MKQKSNSLWRGMCAAMVSGGRGSHVKVGGNHFYRSTDVSFTSPLWSIHQQRSYRGVVRPLGNKEEMVSNISLSLGRMK